MTYNTEKRTELLKFLNESSGRTYTAEEICAALLPDGRGRSTVYRLISKLVDEGKLRRIADAKNRRITYQYVHAGGCAEHLHLKCKECGQLIHLSHETSELLEKNVFSAAEFMLDDGALIYGRCKSCIHGGGCRK